MTTQLDVSPGGEQTERIENFPHPRGRAAGDVREVFTLAYPVILTQMSVTTMGVVDTAMVGRLGPIELASVGFGGIWYWTIFCVFVGTASVVQTFVSQGHGANEPESCGAWTWQGLYVLLVPVSLAAIALMLCANLLMAWLAPSQEVQPLAASYLSVRSLGAVGMCAAMALAAFFRGIGDTRTPLYVTLAANALNVVLDYGLIFGRLGLPAWGVEGAATATAIAEWLSLGLLFVAFSRPELKRAFRTGFVPPAWTSLRRLIRTGAPIGGQWMLEMLSFAAFLTLVARMGDAEMAASQAFIALLSMSFMQASGLAIGVSTLVGRYIGAGDTEAVRRSFVSGLKLCLFISGSIAFLFSLAPDLLMRIFSNDPSVLRLGGPLLAVGAVFQFFDAFGIVTDGALRGAGDTRWPFFVRFSLAWGLFLPAAWLIGIHLDGGLTGAWIGGTVYIVVLTSYLLWRFQSGAWRQIQI